MINRKIHHIKTTMKQTTNETNLNKVALELELEAIKNHMLITIDQVMIETANDGVMIINTSKAYKTWKQDDKGEYEHPRTGKNVIAKQVYKDILINGTLITMYLTIAKKKHELLFATFCDANLNTDKFYQASFRTQVVWGAHKGEF